ncbi:hypothetical protein, partial [Cutibacterium sp. V947]|uniref:hypothetical protein n=1 Tax=Cutibacterium sp. V947 TaxID=3446480 RepID=UPI003EDFCCF1
MSRITKESINKSDTPKRCIKKSLTIKDTLLSSQTSHPQNNPTNKQDHPKATRPTLPHQAPTHKTETNQQNQP